MEFGRRAGHYFLVALAEVLDFLMIASKLAMPIVGTAITVVLMLALPYALWMKIWTWFETAIWPSWPIGRVLDLGASHTPYQGWNVILNWFYRTDLLWSLLVVALAALPMYMVAREALDDTLQDIRKENY